MVSDAGKELLKKEIDDICEEMGAGRHDAFPRWVCQNVLGISDESRISEAVSIGGRNDYGVDAFYAETDGDPTEQHVCWIQSKFSDDLDYRASREDVESFARTVEHLSRCPDHANRIFRQKSAELSQITARNPGIRMRMILAVTGRLNDQAASMLDDPNWRKSRLGPYPGAQLEVVDLEDLLSRLATPPTPSLKIGFDGGVLCRHDEDTGKKSITGYIRADTLVKMSRDNRETVFLENPRQSLGTAAPTHKAILNTLSDEKTRKRFWKLNNGITAICTRLDPTGNDAYRVTNFKIVNGRQTAYTLESSPDPIDSVLLLMTIHEAVDDEERNQISEATNTQNPIRPEDLVTNYPEMTDLTLQCRSDFPEFYFERQPKGFKSAKKSTQNRVTRRRVMGKSGVARSYYAYAESPAEAAMPDKALFSLIGGPGYYERVFKDRKIRDLIVPHIFMQALEELHRRWCRELDDSPSDELARKKGIISKAPVRHFILKFIFESMMSIDGDERESVKDRMIGDFRRLGRHDPLPDRIMGVAQAGYDTFMASFDAGMGETWPEDLVRRIRGAKRSAPVSDRPTPYDIAQSLQQNGARLLPYLLEMKGHIISQVKSDAVRQALLALASGDRGEA